VNLKQYRPKIVRPSSNYGKQYNVLSALQTLWNGIKVPITADNFTVNGEVYKQLSNIWTKPLGK
jgi:hypothetical protein